MILVILALLFVFVIIPSVAVGAFVGGVIASYSARRAALRGYAASGVKNEQTLSALRHLEDDVLNEVLDAFLRRAEIRRWLPHEQQHCGGRVFLSSPCAGLHR